MAVGEIDILSLEAAMLADTAERVERLVERPLLAIISDAYTFSRGATATDEFVDRVRDTAINYGVAVGLEVTGNPSLLRERIDYHNNRHNTPGIIVTYPTIPELAADPEAVYATIETRKNIDGLGSSSKYPSATAEASVEVALKSTPNPLDKRYVVRGLGTVGSDVLKLLNINGVTQVAAIDIHSDPGYARDALSEADVILTATGDPHALTIHDFNSRIAPKLVIDIGKSKDAQGKIVGDIAPALRAWGENEGWQFTRRGNGVSRLATPILLRRLIANAEQLAAS